MLLALALACHDPVLADIDAVPLPTVAAAEPVRERPVVAITGDAVLFDPGPWRALDPEARPRQVLALSEPQMHEYALPALVAAVGPLVDLAAERGEAPVVAVVAGPDAPYRAVVRVLYSLGMAQAEAAELRVATPSGPGALPLPFARVCAGGEPTGACVRASVTETSEGLLVALDEWGDGRPGCWESKAFARTPPPAPGDWRGRVALPAEGACPSVPGRDPAALGAFLARAAPLGPPCAVGSLAPLDATPWGEVVPLLVAMRERSPSTTLAAAVGDPPGCELGLPLP